MAIRLVFSDRAMVALAVETLEKIKTETGGVFLGYRRGNNWYVLETIDPGPRAIFQRAYFEYDQSYINHLINKISRLYKEQLDLIGLWHRHPGSFDRFSGTDDITNSQYAELSEYGAVSLLVNIDPQFRVSAYHVSLPLHYEKINYEVGDHLIPDELLRLKDHSRLTETINEISEKQIVGPYGNSPDAAKRGRSVSNGVNLTKALEEFLTFHNEPKLNGEIGGLELEETDSLDAVLATLQDDLTFFEDNQIPVVLSINGKQQLVVSRKGSKGNGDDFNLAFSIVGSTPIFIFNDIIYKYQPGLIKTSIIEYYKKKGDNYDKHNASQKKRRIIPSRNLE